MTSSRRKNEQIDSVKLYNITARTYDSLYRKEQYIKYNYIFEELRLKPGKTVLDIGCGTGLLIEYLLSKRLDSFHRYICVDPSIEMLSRATGRGGDPRIIYILAYGEDLLLLDESVDTIFMFTVWDNLQDRKAVLEKVKKFLDRGGYIIISIISRNKKTHMRDTPADLDNGFRRIGEKIDEFYMYQKQ